MENTEGKKERNTLDLEMKNIYTLLGKKRKKKGQAKMAEHQVFNCLTYKFLVRELTKC